MSASPRMAEQRRFCSRVGTELLVGQTHTHPPRTRCRHPAGQGRCSGGWRRTRPQTEPAESEERDPPTGPARHRLRALENGQPWWVIVRPPDGGAASAADDISSMPRWKARATRSACVLASSARSPANSSSTVPDHSPQPPLEVPSAQPDLRVQLRMRTEGTAAVGLGSQRSSPRTRPSAGRVRLEVELRDVDEDEADDGVLEGAPVEGVHVLLAIGTALDVTESLGHSHPHHYGGLVDRATSGGGAKFRDATRFTRARRAATVGR